MRQVSGRANEEREEDAGLDAELGDRWTWRDADEPWRSLARLSSRQRTEVAVNHFHTPARN